MLQNYIFIFFWPKKNINKPKAYHFSSTKLFATEFPSRQTSFNVIIFEKERT